MAITYVPIPTFRQQHRDPYTGKYLVGRDAIYAAIRDGRCPHVKVGRRILIPSDALDIMAGRPTSEKAA